MVFPPQRLQRRYRPASGTCTLSGRASTLTSAWRPQAWHLAVTVLGAVGAHVGERHSRAAVVPHLNAYDVRPHACASIFHASPCFENV